MYSFKWFEWMKLDLKIRGGLSFFSFRLNQLSILQTHPNEFAINHLTNFWKNILISYKTICILSELHIKITLLIHNTGSDWLLFRTYLIERLLVKTVIDQKYKIAIFENFWDEILPTLNMMNGLIKQIWKNVHKRIRFRIFFF